MSDMCSHVRYIYITAWNLGYEIDKLIHVHLLEKLSEMVCGDSSECAGGLV